MLFVFFGGKQTLWSGSLFQIAVSKQRVLAEIAGILWALERELSTKTAICVFDRDQDFRRGEPRRPQR
jgi:hypothetical protein